ncbi:MAG: hypothetical protein PWQ41_699 [Bacillota bacterium]|jgi:hypothetical protein|nr:hypothetical protein [Bacillota bacterium]MDK2785217.1 hypothetical protein [Bacillota bacterium]MDK2883235.1 hypothetical protein [Bacillota bacterium]MDK2924925.1 hypothetical protein [Bacillota bacterium]
MDCLDCGNCRKGEAVYYCPARNDFVIVDGVTKIKERRSIPEEYDDYTERKKKYRRERGSLRGTG